MRPSFKAIVNKPLDSFKVELQSGEQFDYPWHFHPEMELTYIQNGKGVRYIGNSIENYEEGDLVLLGENVPHCWINEDMVNQRPQCITVYWKKDFMGDEWLAMPEFEGIGRMLLQSGKGLRFDKSLAEDFERDIARLHKLDSFERLVLFLQILHRMAQSGKFSCICEQEYLEDLKHSDGERIDSVLRYVSGHYNEKITLEQVAQKANMSKGNFSRYFGKVMKKPFFVFLNEYRVNHACKLLIETEMQVSEICYASGYQSLPFFYRQFKKIIGQKPLAYRSLYRRDGLTHISDC